MADGQGKFAGHGLVETLRSLGIERRTGVDLEGGCGDAIDHRLQDTPIVSTEDPVAWRNADVTTGRAQALGKMGSGIRAEGRTEAFFRTLMPTERGVHRLVTGIMRRPDQPAIE